MGVLIVLALAWIGVSAAAEAQIPKKGETYWSTLYRMELDGLRPLQPVPFARGAYPRSTPSGPGRMSTPHVVELQGNPALAFDASDMDLGLPRLPSWRKGVLRLEVDVLFPSKQGSIHFELDTHKTHRLETRYGTYRWLRRGSPRHKSKTTPMRGRWFKLTLGVDLDEKVWWIRRDGEPFLEAPLAWDPPGQLKLRVGGRCAIDNLILQINQRTVYPTPAVNRAPLRPRPSYARPWWASLGRRPDVAGPPPGLQGLNPLEVRGLDHVEVPVRETERALAFYRKLGFRRSEQGHRGLKIQLRRSNGGPTLELVPLPRRTRHRPEHVAVALRVRSIGAATERLEAAGIEIEQRLRGGRERSVLFRDPDGNLIELVGASYAEIHEVPRGPGGKKTPN